MAAINLSRLEKRWDHDIRHGLHTALVDFEYTTSATDTIKSTLLTEGEMVGLQFLRGRWSYHLDGIMDDSPQDQIIQRIDWRIAIPPTPTESIDLLGARIVTVYGSGGAVQRDQQTSTQLPGILQTSTVSGTNNGLSTESGNYDIPLGLIGNTDWQTRILFQMASTDASTSLNVRCRALLSLVFLDAGRGY
jgi:hypothetical protein